MEKADAIEGNVIHSFNRVKADIIRLQDEFMQLRETQIILLNRLSRVESKKTKSEKPVKIVKEKTIAVKKKNVGTTYVASKDGKKFHVSNCPYAQNIKPKTKVKFKTKIKPLNLGYKPCSCIK